MRMLTSLSAAVALAIGVAALPAQAQIRPNVVQAATRDLTASERTAAVDAVLQAMEGQYVFPDRVPAIREAVRAAQAAGRYDLADPRAFARALTEDLRRSGNDGHLYISHDPEQFAAAGRAPPRGPNPELEALWTARYRASNSGLTEQRILPGNVRYLKVSSFGWINDETGLAWDGAMRFLNGGEAVIIDLRGNGGGAHDAVRYAISHFMEPDQPLITFLEAGEPPNASRTLSHLPAGRMIGKPLYVLTDGRVGSAAEEFAYSVQQFRLGTLVGQTTAGGANNNRLIPVAPGFMLSVSYGRPEHPVSGTNWEGVGVAPDVEVSGDQALDRAHDLIREAAARSQ